MFIRDLPAFFLFSLLRLGGCRPKPSILFPQSFAYRKEKIKAICFFPSPSLAVITSAPPAAPASWEQTHLFSLCLRQTWGLPRFFDICTYHRYIVPAICSFTTLGPHSLSPSHACINADGHLLSDIHPYGVPYPTTDTHAQIETKRRLPICTPMLTRRLVHPLLLSHFP